MKKLALSLAAASLAVSAFAHDGDGHTGMKMGSILLYGVGSYSNTHGTTTSKYATANNNTADQPRTLNWEVSPGIGYTITDNFTIGVDFMYNGSKTTYDRTTLGSPTLGSPAVDQVKTWDYGVGPFARYTWPIGEHFFAYGQAQAHYLRGRETYRYVTATTGGTSFVADDNFKGLDGSFTPAIGIKVCHSVGLTFGIGGVSYRYTKNDYSPVNVGLLGTNNTPTTGAVPAAGSEFSSKNNDFNVTFGRQVNIGIEKEFGGHHMHRHHGEGDGEMMDRHMDTNDDNTDNDSDKKKKKRNDDE